MSSYAKFLIIAIVGIFIYSSSLDYDSVKCDDTRLIDHYTKTVNTKSGVFSEFSNSYLNTTYYRPLVNISFRIDAALWGTDASKYHRLNILLHIVFCSILFIVIRRLSGSETMALLAALIYSVHPLFANAVAWIPGRNDLMLGIFGLAAFLYLDNYLKSRANKDLLLNVLFVILALFTKETAAILPLLFLLYAYINKSEGESLKDKKILFGSWFGVGLIWFLLRATAEKGENANIFGIDVFISNLRVLPEFLSKFFIPIDLSVLPTYSASATIIGSVILLALTGLIFVATQKDKKMLAWSLLWFILLVLPTTIFQRGNADEWNDYLYCRSYLPLVGILFMFAFLLKNKLEKANQTLLLSIGLIPIVFFAYINYDHVDAYESPVSFYENAIEQDSSRAFYYQIIGNYYAENGQIDKAETYFEKAANNQSGYYKRYFQLGEVSMMKQEYSKAILHYKKALELQPDEKPIMFALSQAYVSAVYLDSAQSIWERMTNLFPKEPEAYFELFNISVMNLDYDNIDKYGKVIVENKFQNKVLSERLDGIAKDAFKNQALDASIYFWQYAYQLDKTNTTLLKYITGSYYVLGNKDSTKKYYNIYKQKGGALSTAEEQTYGSFLD